MIELGNHRSSHPTPWRTSPAEGAGEGHTITYRCVRSWDGRRFEFHHPAGRASKDWDFADGQAVMAYVVDAIAFESWGRERVFTVRFDVCTGLDARGLRQFVITTPRGAVTLEPLDLSYAATFGMCSVFESGSASRSV